MFVEEIDKITGKKNTMGIIEQVAEIRAEEAMKKGIRKGLEKGRKETLVNVVKNLLSTTKLSVDKIASIAGVSVSFVNEIRQGKQ